MINDISAQKYCRDDISKIENYYKAISDFTQTWHCHHKMELHDDYNNTKSELIMMNLYFDRPAEELIFLTPSEHSQLHASNKIVSRRLVQKKLEYLRNISSKKMCDENTRLENMYNFYKTQCKPEEQYYRNKVIDVYAKAHNLQLNIAKRHVKEFENVYDVLFL